MARYLEVCLEKRDVRAVARLLDDKAPRTCEAVWNGLPLGGQAYHAKYARNEIYALVPSFADPEPGPEHTTITPIPGDLVYFGFEAWQLSPATHGYDDEELFAASRPVDLAVFYGRNNLLLNPDFGFVPGNVFGAIESGLDELAEAARDLWLGGAAGEVLSYRRLDHD